MTSTTVGDPVILALNERLLKTLLRAQHKNTSSSSSASSAWGGGTAIVWPSNTCGGKDPVCETFCTNKGPKIFESALIRVKSFEFCTNKDPFQKIINFTPLFLD